MDRKEQKAKSEAEKVAKGRAKGDAEFAKPTKEEMAMINKAVNDRRQNLIQAMKAYYQLVLTKRQADLFQQRFENAISDKVEIKDNYGLPMSEEELKLEAMKNYVQLRFMNRDLLERQVEFKSIWDLSEQDLEKYWNKWFVNNEKID